MTDLELRDTIRLMLAGWDAATEDQRQAALADAAERAEMVELLGGKYGVSAADAHAAMTAARERGWAEIADLAGRWHLRIATDEGGYTIEHLESE